MYPWFVLHHSFDQLTSPIGRTVVNDENIEPFILLKDGSDESRDVLALVVRRNYDKSSFSHLPKLRSTTGRSQPLGYLLTPSGHEDAGNDQRDR
jgi:hypothetical protein